MSIDLLLLLDHQIITIKAPRRWSPFILCSSSNTICQPSTLKKCKLYPRCWRFVAQECLNYSNNQLSRYNWEVHCKLKSKCPIPPENDAYCTGMIWWVHLQWCHLKDLKDWLWWWSHEQVFLVTMMIASECFDCDDAHKWVVGCNHVHEQASCLKATNCTKHTITAMSTRANNQDNCDENCQKKEKATTNILQMTVILFFVLLSTRIPALTMHKRVCWVPIDSTINLIGFWNPKCQLRILQWSHDQSNWSKQASLIATMFVSNLHPVIK